jgi:GntR family transcriptional regulator
MAIWLDVDPRSGVPIYVQIVQQIKHAIEVGVLQPGEQLPTIRQLAGELTIAPNTIVKAYNELQIMQLIESRQGVGTAVVAPPDGSMATRQVEALIERLSALVRDAAQVGVEPACLRAHFEAQVGRWYGMNNRRKEDDSGS